MDVVETPGVHNRLDRKSRKRIPGANHRLNAQKTEQRWICRCKREEGSGESCVDSFRCHLTHPHFAFALVVVVAAAAAGTLVAVAPVAAHSLLFSGSNIAGLTLFPVRNYHSICKTIQKAATSSENRAIPRAVAFFISTYQLETFSSDAKRNSYQT